MKKRIFYVINLDNSRILTLGTTMIAIIVGSYAFGYHSASQLQQTQVSSYSTASSKISNNDSKSPSSSNTDFGKSIYENQNSNTQYEVEDTTSTKYTPDDSLKKKSQSKKTSTKYTKKRATKKYKKATSKKRSLTKKRKSKREPTLATKISTKKRHSARKKSTLLKQEGDGIRLSNASRTLASTKVNKPSAVATKTVTRYSLQTGSFHSQKAAQRMSNGLKTQGFLSNIVKKNGKYNVRVGLESIDKKLWKLESKLRRKKYSPIKVKIR